jgi:hypothetical protein
MIVKNLRSISPGAVGVETSWVLIAIAIGPFAYGFRSGRVINCPDPLTEAAGMNKSTARRLGGGGSRGPRGRMGSVENSNSEMGESSSEMSMSESASRVWTSVTTGRVALAGTGSGA